jgi:hypothetical protein
VLESAQIEIIRGQIIHIGGDTIYTIKIPTLRCRFHEKAARVTRAAAPKPSEFQAYCENEKKNPDWLAEVCVVFWTTLALTLEV